MSASQTLEELMEAQPEGVRAALTKLRAWMAAHTDRRLLFPVELAREIRGVEASELATALMLMVKWGLLRKVYKVLTPSGVFVDGEFDDSRSIPLRLPDRREQYFETADAEIVPVFIREG